MGTNQAHKADCCIVIGKTWAMPVKIYDGWCIQEAPPAPEKEALKPLKELVAETNPNRMVFTGTAKVAHALALHMLSSCKVFDAGSKRRAIYKKLRWHQAE